MAYVVIGRGFVPMGVPKRGFAFTGPQVFYSPFQARSGLLARQLFFMAPPQTVLSGAHLHPGLLNALLLHCLMQQFYSRPSNGAFRANPFHQPSHAARAGGAQHHTQAPLPPQGPFQQIEKAHADLAQAMRHPALATGNQFKKPWFEQRKAEFAAAYAALVDAKRSGLNTTEAGQAFAKAAKGLRMHLHPDKAAQEHYAAFNDATQKLGELEGLLIVR